MNIRRYEGIASLRNKVIRRVINMKILDINKLRTTKNLYSFVVIDDENGGIQGIPNN